ncbi:MAG: hypothetical protein U5K70_04455 [Halodesulfurarchaeum sp.]|nr:hypothetical protein [Halodesulfurarchaeum sp.]
MERRRDDPTDLSLESGIPVSPRRAPDSTEKSIHGWEYRLKPSSSGASRRDRAVGELRRYDLDEYYELRSAEIAPATLEGEMWTLKMFVDFLGDIGAVESDLDEAVRIPDIDPEDRSNDTKLETDAALALIQYYRDSPKTTRLGPTHSSNSGVDGARQGGLRALDIRDAELDDNPYVYFRHRPEQGARSRTNGAASGPWDSRPRRPT